jgi:hypothetical protein
MADDGNIIDVLIAVDAESLVANLAPGSASAPTPVTSDAIYMMVRSGNAVFGQGSKELKLSARTLDVIRWRMTSLSFNAGYFGLLYKFFALSGNPLISTPEPLLAQVNAPLPDPAHPTVPRTQTLQTYFWNCNVLAQGEVTYAFQFMICDRAGQPCGYYFWDPFIAITD